MKHSYEDCFFPHILEKYPLILNVSVFNISLFQIKICLAIVKYMKTKANIRQANCSLKVSAYFQMPCLTVGLAVWLIGWWRIFCPSLCVASKTTHPSAGTRPLSGPIWPACFFFLPQANFSPHEMLLLLLLLPQFCCFALPNLTKCS